MTINQRNDITLRTSRKLIFKMTLNDLEGQRSFSKNDLYNMNVKCTKFDVSMLISFEVFDN